MEDAKFLFDLRNDPAIYAYFVNSSPTDWENHKKWLLRKLINPDCNIFIIIDGVTKVGQIRLDHTDWGWDVSLSVLPDFSGQGIGTAGIQLAVEWLKNEVKTYGAIKAAILKGNIASERAFSKAGFKYIGCYSPSNKGDDLDLNLGLWSL